jgi:serine/threonine protein kinase
VLPLPTWHNFKLFETSLHFSDESSYLSQAKSMFRHKPIFEGEVKVEVKKPMFITAESFVFRAESVRFTEKLILKVIHPTVDERRMLNEVAISDEISHFHSPYFVPVLRRMSVTFVGADHATTALLMPRFDLDLCEYLHERNQGLTEPEIRPLGRDMIEAIFVLHRHQLSHNDIKPENYLLTGDGKHAVLCDFGMATRLNEEGVATSEWVVEGTPCYNAPEFVDLPRTWNKAIDLWGVGCTLLFMLTNNQPFVDQDEILEGDIDEKINNGRPSVEFRDLLKKLICRNWKQRLTAAQAREHPFFHERTALKERLRPFVPMEYDMTSQDT